jgi:hypothetical protein
MDAVGIVVTVLLVALLWVAAVVFGRDSREGGDWLPGSTSATGPFDRETEPVARRPARRSVR